jgi:ribosome biogenesis GTPase A
MFLSLVVAFRSAAAPSRRLFHLSSSTINSDSGYARPVVQWYPGHIAKAERQLKETFRAVDVVVEVRDARIAKATSHPQVPSWCAGRPRIVVFTHMDHIPSLCKRQWTAALEQFEKVILEKQAMNEEKQAEIERNKYLPPQQQSTSRQFPFDDVLFVNAKVGSGVHALVRSITKAGAHVQERRARRGLKSRALRVGVIGYPNVGKSALINRLVGRKRAKTANTPGVTRSLQWIRVRADHDSSKKQTTRESSFELLDSPGIIPASLVDQSDACLLAACNCIGDAAYDNQAVAAFLCEWTMALWRSGYSCQAPDWRNKCMERYKFDPLQEITVSSGLLGETDRKRFRSGEDMVFAVADATCQGDPEDAARKILQDFRTGRMGLICLQVAPTLESDAGQTSIGVKSHQEEDQDKNRAYVNKVIAEREERAVLARETAKERGLELPPSIAPEGENADKLKKMGESIIGKGRFDGW